MCRYYTSSGGIMVPCGDSKWNLTQAQAAGYEAGSTATTLPSDDVIIAWAQMMIGMPTRRD